MAGILGELMGPAKLVAITIGEIPEQFKVDGELKIGRRRFFKFKNETKIYLEYPLLSKDQGRLIHLLGEWHYINLTDENTTTIDDEELPLKGDRILKNGDIIRIKRGGDMLIFVFLMKFSGELEWKRVFLDREQQVYHIYSHVSEFNKDTENSDTPDTEPSEDSVAPSAPEENTGTSNPESHHAILRYTDGYWRVEDVNTKRGVYVNQNRIEGYKLLNLYDIINIGNTHFVFYGDYIAYNLETFRDNDLEIHIKERSVRGFFKRQVLLKDINLRIEPGNMVLILGGSGAGKTTFINAVTGYEKAKAAIRQGDVDVYDDYEKMKYRIGMVPQQDLLRGDDTVIMTLRNAAEMRMPATTEASERKERVNELLRLFGLENVRGELVDKLSGGQRKRLSIATEFVANPSIFILDEPDSGLDGVMARDLMKQLRDIADQDKIVMVITHTPDRVIDLFDKVIVLAKDSNQTGQLAFYGTVDEARKFFNRTTMEDIILTVNSEGEGGEGQADIYIRKFARLREEVPFTPPDIMENGVGVMTSEGTVLEAETIKEDPIFAENDEKPSSEDIKNGDLLSNETVEVALND
ncbi:ATP-binding cassette domain-containing protein [Oribacterium sp. P6A1]|uniref:ATP-binding cassette domain-containing protein n=1 Tax=Oribacterium sp. P6A1 TaxID=1410612 RepID=UPI00068BFB11|nr:ATP-binding cassette domain-containing protein [Oribacterium sp. P6A1]